MVDKVKPLKIENPATGGTDTDLFPTETNPVQDYLATKGLAFENLDTHLAEKVGELLYLKSPDQSEKPTYNASNDLDFVEIFRGAVQTTPNRKAKITMGYDASKFPISETWQIFDTDGSTVLRTVAYTYTIAGANITNAVEATT